MELELKTKSLYEIVKKCKSNNIDIKKTKIKVKLFEDISEPGVPIIKLFLQY